MPIEERQRHQTLTNTQLAIAIINFMELHDPTEQKYLLLRNQIRAMGYTDYLQKFILDMDI